MLDTQQAVTVASKRIEDFVSSVIEDLSYLGPDAAGFLGHLRDYLSGGKRFRVLATVLGYSTRGDSVPDSVLDVAAGLEIFHAAALVHDDIMDRSDTRRGRPSAHRAFEADHHASGFAGDGAHFGMSAGLLFGDLLLALSDEMITRGLEPHGHDGARARHEFNVMRRDVTVGQYLDVVEEVAWPTISPHEASGRALHVATYKSAKYSIEAPLRIGAAMAGADDHLLAGLSAFGVPVGMAFQLRDDVLGVFGESALTGKPVGDDLREGKRTALIALTMERLGPAADSLTMFGRHDASPADITRIQEAIHDCGALDALEELIDGFVRSADEALQHLDVDEPTRTALSALAQQVTRRAA